MISGCIDVPVASDFRDLWPVGCGFGIRVRVLGIWKEAEDEQCGKKD